MMRSHAVQRHMSRQSRTRSRARTRSLAREIDPSFARRDRVEKASRRVNAEARVTRKWRKIIGCLFLHLPLFRLRLTAHGFAAASSACRTVLFHLPPPPILSRGLKFSPKEISLTQKVSTRRDGAVDRSRLKPRLDYALKPRIRSGKFNFNPFRSAEFASLNLQCLTQA